MDNTEKLMRSIDKSLSKIADSIGKIEKTMRPMFQINLDEVDLERLKDKMKNLNGILIAETEAPEIKRILDIGNPERLRSEQNGEK